MINFTSHKSNFYLHQQCSVALKYAENALAAGAPPQTPLGSSRRSPEPIVGWGGGYPLPRPHPSGAPILAPAALVFQPEQYHFLERSGDQGPLSNYKQVQLTLNKFYGSCTHPDALLKLINQVVHEADEELVGGQLRHPFFVVRHDKFQLLESVRKDVQYERRRVLYVHARMLAKFHHLVHHLPGLVDGFSVDRHQPLGATGVGQRSLD